jgi:hypothetical protein
MWYMQFYSDIERQRYDLATSLISNKPNCHTYPFYKYCTNKTPITIDREYLGTPLDELGADLSRIMMQLSASMI